MNSIEPGFKILEGDGNGMLNIRQTCYCGNQKVSKVSEDSDLWILAFATPECEECQNKEK